MNALDRLASIAAAPFARRQASDVTFGEWLDLMTLNGPFMSATSLSGDQELPPGTLDTTAGLYSRSSVVFAALQTRWRLFAQARYQFQQMQGGHEGALFGTQDLAVLEHPEPGETTLDLNFRAIQYADLAGDWFGVRRPASLVTLPENRGLPYAAVDRIKPLRPDWTVIVLGSRTRRDDPVELAQDPDAEIVGFGYTPGGAAGSSVVSYGREEVAHFHPNTGPLSRYRGMPLVLAAMPEIIADNGATNYKRAYFKNAATPQIAVSFPPGWDENKAKQWAKLFEAKHQGSLNAYKALYLGAGMTYQVVGSTVRDMAFTEMQGKAETRIAAVTGMHPVIIPFSEALGGSSLNAGNYQAAQRSTSDITLRYLWPNMCGSLETIVPARPGTRLWYDERSVPFLQADVKDRAEVRARDAAAMQALKNAGYTGDSIRDAIVADDFSLLVDQGLPSVQLQPGPPPQQAAIAFSPSGRLATYGPVAAGTELAADHPLVLAYPSLFAAAEDAIADKARRLRAGGMSIRAIAAEIDRTDRHVRRLLTPGT